MTLDHDRMSVATDLMNLLDDGDGPISLTITRNEGRWSVTLLDTLPGRSGTFFGQGVSLDEALIDCCDVRLRVGAVTEEEQAAARTAFESTRDEMRTAQRARFRVVDSDGGEG